MSVKQIIGKTSNVENLFFENINKIDKPLVRLIKKTIRENTN